MLSSWEDIILHFNGLVNRLVRCVLSGLQAVAGRGRVTWDDCIVVVVRLLPDQGDRLRRQRGGSPGAGRSEQKGPEAEDQGQGGLEGEAQGCRVERDAPWGTPAPSSNRTCSFPAYGSPCGTGFISFAPLRPSAPFHIDSDGCSSIWTSGFRRAAT